jgi:hypothetical protein
MKVARSFAILFTCTLSLAASQHAHAKAKAKWVCMKDGEEVEVKGKKPKEKKKDCTAQGGVWEKAKPASEEQNSGMGGAW